MKTNKIQYKGQIDKYYVSATIEYYKHSCCIATIFIIYCTEQNPDPITTTLLPYKRIRSEKELYDELVDYFI